MVSEEVAKVSYLSAGKDIFNYLLRLQTYFFIFWQIAVWSEEIDINLEILITTIITSTAALVAIIGGFLLS
ncbi:MAG: hypothetical protein ACQEWV_26410 [Bacillota bacterium]